MTKQISNGFVFNGFERWSEGQTQKTGEKVYAQLAPKAGLFGLFGNIKVWLKREQEVMPQQKHGDKSSLKILW